MDGHDVIDWGEASEIFDEIKNLINGKDLSAESEAQTRFDVIDRVIKEVLNWKHGQIHVEVPDIGDREGYIDYVLRAGDYSILIEAKKIGATFPSPTKKKKLKITGSVLGIGEVSKAIKQARGYAISKAATLVLVTNGLCWCYFLADDEIEEAYAGLLFPFDIGADAESLFNLFNSTKVEGGSLEVINNTSQPLPENRLLSEVRDADARVDRNNIADYIAPALNKALYADALLSNPKDLEKCFVPTEARIKFDSMLGVYLADAKPDIIQPAKRIKKGQSPDHLEALIKTSSPSFAPPVTLIIGSVGAGKSTYLKHFELVTGKGVLEKHKAHWIYIDFEQMGREGNPRKFIYEHLKNYLLAEHPQNPTDYRNVIEPAYQEEIAALARGPYALIATKREKFDEAVTLHIQKDFEQVEPYVDKLFHYITSTNLCVVVLDNIDLYEDEQLETTVFAEGLALSKRIHANVIVSIRDRTFVRHRNDSAFDAFELRKLWLDPPPFKTVLSKRLSYSRKILENVPASIDTRSGAHIIVPDLSVFFEIVQRSVLTSEAGDFIDAISDVNIRKGLTLVTNFLTSGHIQADRAIKSYLSGQHDYQFPFHEIFKGTMLGQWKHYKEDRAECINLFDSRLGAKSLRLLRLYLLKYLRINAQDQNKIEVPAIKCVELFSKSGASEVQILTTLNLLYRFGYIRNISAEDISIDSTIAITRSGSYISKYLNKKLSYVEACMHDTAIEDSNVWNDLIDITEQIEFEHDIPTRVQMREERVEIFTNYLLSLESKFLELSGGQYLAAIGRIKQAVLSEARAAYYAAFKNYRSNN